VPLGFAGFILFIMGTSFPGGAVLMFAGLAIIRFISSGEGIPGVGVRPGLIPFFNCSGLGMPGVGVVPFGIWIEPFEGIPGAFAGGETGCTDSPGGKLALSRVTATPVLTFELLFIEFAFDVDEPPHPTISTLNKPMTTTKILDITPSFDYEIRSLNLVL